MRDNVTGFSFANLGLFVGCGDGIYNAVYSLVILGLFTGIVGEGIASAVVGVYVGIYSVFCMLIGLFSNQLLRWFNKARLLYVSMLLIGACYIIMSMSVNMITFVTMDYLSGVAYTLIMLLIPLFMADFSKNDKVSSRSDIIYFGNLKSTNGSVKHTGDNLTGAGEGDDEQIIVELKSIPSEYNRLVFVVNIYDARNRNQHFGMIQNAFIRIVNASTNEELLKYNLTDNYANQTALITGELYREGTEWKFAAIGTGSQAGSLSDLVATYQ